MDLRRGFVVIPAAADKANRDDKAPLHGELRTALEALPVEGDRYFAFREQLTDSRAIRALGRLA